MTLNVAISENAEENRSQITEEVIELLTWKRLFLCLWHRCRIFKTTHLLALTTMSIHLRRLKEGKPNLKAASNTQNPLEVRSYFKEICWHR